MLPASYMLTVTPLSEDRQGCGFVANSVVVVVVAAVVVAAAVAVAAYGATASYGATSISPKPARVFPELVVLTYSSVHNRVLTEDPRCADRFHSPCVHDPPHLFAQLFAAVVGLEEGEAEFSARSLLYDSMLH